jgi:NhaP-type Na+/H+ or K+/H+ antiporter
MALLSIGLILGLGFLFGVLFEKIKLPKIIGMIFIGILIGPSVLNIINGSVLNISAELRQTALVIILTRAGLSLDLENLKKIGRPALLMCFVPAIFEIAVITLIAPPLLGVTIFEALLIGSVVAAVSPAIIIPRMLKLQEAGYGKNKNVPELIMAGASVDDIFVIVLFYAFLGLSSGNALNLRTLVEIPVSIILGIIIGIVVGLGISRTLKKITVNEITQFLIVFAMSLALLGFETFIQTHVKFSALISIITLGMVIFLDNKIVATILQKQYASLWVFFEIILFVLVGISVDLNYVLSAGFMPIVVILIALIGRTIGVYISLIFTNLNFKERLFIIISYIPKATVQASIGAIALTNGLSVGPLILTIAVFSILITAPIGAILTDLSYKKLLQQPTL